MGLPCEFFNSKSGATSPTAIIDKKGFDVIDDDNFEWRKDWHATRNIATTTATRVKLILIYK